MKDNEPLLKGLVLASVRPGESPEQAPDLAKQHSTAATPKQRVPGACKTAPQEPLKLTHRPMSDHIVMVSRSSEFSATRRERPTVGP